MNSWLIGQDPYQQSIPDNELIVDKVILMKQGYLLVGIRRNSSVTLCVCVGLHEWHSCNFLPHHAFWKMYMSTVLSHLKKCAFGYQISEIKWFEIRFCTGSWRRTPDLKFIKNSYDVVSPPVTWQEDLRDRSTHHPGKWIVCVCVRTEDSVQPLLYLSISKPYQLSSTDPSLSTVGW
jgi:hypothetical protein